MRRSTVPNDDCSSRRASGAPRQKWIPAPNVTCGFGSRSRRELVRLVEHVGVPVRRTEDEAELGAPRYPDVSDLDVLEHPSFEQLQRRVEPHQLLDRDWQQGGVGTQPCERVGVPEQRPPAVAGDVHGRLVSRVQQQHAGADQLVFGEPFPVVDHERQLADQVAGRIGAPLSRERRASSRRRPRSRRRRRGRPRSSDAARTSGRCRPTTAAAGGGRPPAPRAARRSRRPAEARRSSGAGRTPPSPRPRRRARP